MLHSKTALGNSWLFVRHTRIATSEPLQKSSPHGPIVIAKAIVESHLPHLALAWFVAAARHERQAPQNGQSQKAPPVYLPAHVLHSPIVRAVASNTWRLKSS